LAISNINVFLQYTVLFVTICNPHIISSQNVQIYGTILRAGKTISIEMRVKKERCNVDTLWEVI